MVIVFRFLLLVLLIVFLILVRPQSRLHQIQVLALPRVGRLALYAFVALLCACIVYISGMVPVWTSATALYPHHLQYEQMTDALLEGHLYLDLEPSESLLALDNPYSAEERMADRPEYQWDTAYYNGHFYMYFGIVPVLILFLPLRLIGIHLVGYQATQIFIVLAILAFFAILKLFTEQYCRNLSLPAFVSLFCMCSGISLWLCIKEPSLYCTAIASGLAFALWGFYLSYRGLVLAGSERSRILFIVFGALCSALAFGCRPPIGLSCIILLPLGIHFLRYASSNHQRIRGIVAFLVPFVVVGILLMLYNEARFENPFEFGQSYQLSVADQTSLSETEVPLCTWLNGIVYQFLATSEISEEFPFIGKDGILVLFPVLLLGYFPYHVKKGKSSSPEEEKAATPVPGLVPALIVSILVMIFFQAMWSPYMIERYRMDISFLVCLLFLLGSLHAYRYRPDRARYSCLLTLGCAYTLCVLFLLLFDADFIEAHYTLYLAVKEVFSFR